MHLLYGLVQMVLKSQVFSLQPYVLAELWSAACWPWFVMQTIAEIPHALIIIKLL